FLVAAVIGSGVMGEPLANGNVAIALLANTIATVPLSWHSFLRSAVSAHFNLVVTFMDAFRHGVAWRETPNYFVAQVAGGIIGALCAHLMFRLPMTSLSVHMRSGPAQVFSEVVATFMGLLTLKTRICPIRGGRVHYGWLLVHSFDLLRQ